MLRGIKVVSIKKIKDISLETLRHSTSHIMAQAVVELFPDTKLAIGPAIEEGFYYDFDTPQPFKPEDLEKIENRMREIVAGNHKFVRTEMSKKDAVEFFKKKNEPYKIELLNDIPDEKVSLYQQDTFIDLCRGPHLENTKGIRHFKLLSIAGAYWRGSEKNKMLQRIYGTVFPTKEELEQYLKRQEEAKKRDHRILGKLLDLFSVHEEIGAGLIHWHPKGAIVREILEDFWKKEHIKNGYQIVYTPHIASEEIYKISGHLEKYSDMIYSPMDIDGKPFRVKPMNCPGHILIFKTKLHSYRELPVRFAEMGAVYRHELSGVLHGLMRVRGFTIDDAHIFCTKEQVENEIISVFDFTIKFLKKFGFSEFEIFLATRPETYIGEIEKWDLATASLKKALEKTGYKYEIDAGGGAFYGPKIDLKVKDVLGRSWQCSTIQFDFNLPERFDITYRNEDGKDEKVIMIHRAIFGSLERFFGVLIEHYGGAFPFWLAPVQIKILPITDAQIEYARLVKNELGDLRVEIDSRNEKLNYKIREAQMEKIPYMIILGEKEKNTKTIAVRKYGRTKTEVFSVSEFLKKLFDK
ncbi:MAG: threonine--tRNA ligase [Elusimicrobia bacterium CG06_land_8_20_14_3_00_38_11]|nr:MAG: threonine--tRNA ligase [Elusimicrobia bacterium CG06_land_8_20_14_3_00_38_11]